MIQVTNGAKHFGPKVLFENLDWMITPNDRVGLVGANGTGKTTLLKILAGIDSLDSGTVSVAKGVTAGYLPQDGLSLSGRSVFAECMTVFDDVRALEVEQESLAHQMGELDPSSPEYQQVSDRFHQSQAEFEARDGYAIEAQVGAVLSGLGFSREDWTRRTEQFSGGWQMRIALAKLLLQKPNLLLLDEPTNHLDLEARNWLEGYLIQYPYAFALVSHDRYFLDVTVKKVVEMWNKNAHFYSGNYSRYEVLKNDRRAQLEAAYRNQRERVEQLETFISRFRYQATKAKQVQSRIKELARIERIEIPPDEKAIHFRFPQPKPSGRVAAEFRNVSKSYGEKHVFSGVNFMIERGDRVALVGVNGAGKSTLIKILAGAETVTSGEYTLGHNAQPDYFAQDQYKELDVNARILDDLGQVAPRATNTELRSILGCFLFSEDDVFKPIGVLSGGERNRYALARMLMIPGNFLLLDEPTNHLDMRAKDVLLEALEGFSGTVVFVSHDRYFIDKLATRVFEIGEGEVRVYPGNYEDYVWRKSGVAANNGAPPVATLVVARVAPTTEATPVHAAPVPAKNPKGSPAPAATPISHGKPSAHKHAAHKPAPSQSAPKPATASTVKQRLNPIKLRQMKERRRAIEDEVTRLEVEIADYEGELANFKSAEETVRVSCLLEVRKADLKVLMAEWEEVSLTIESNR